MLVIGLTGGIGVGKSAAAAHFASRGVPVFSADSEVHRLYQAEAVPRIKAVFPAAIENARIDRARLSREIAGSPEKLRALEAIVHPLVIKGEIEFLKEKEKAGARMVLLEIPLLFETGAEARVDVTVVVSATEQLQRERVLARPGMTTDKIEHLLARQLPDAEKLARADFVVDSSTTLAEMRHDIDKLIESLKSREGTVMERLRNMTFE